VKELSEELLQQMTQALVDELDPEAIYLFGSHAWGEPDADSDVDFMVVVDDNTPDQDWRTRPSLRGRIALTRFRVALDIVVRKRRDFERLQSHRSSLTHEVARRGRKLYARP
jgi:predicted nucleotidyltransferase